MAIRYFEIRSPRADFTGKIGAVAFADGVARVSFDDTREGGVCPADEHAVQVGRSAVLFARRRPSYVVVETDVAGQPLPEADEGKPKRRGPVKKVDDTPPPKDPAPPADPKDPKKEGE